MLEKIANYIYKNPEVMLALSKLESRFLKENISRKEIKKPIYVTGLARSGTTIALEFLSEHKNLASHSYSDFPFIFTPYFWNKVNVLFARNTEKSERAHKDGMYVNSASPESMEEMIWASFYDDLHDPRKNNCLDGRSVNAEFEVFYKEHIKKLLLVKNGERYLSKANYNLSRIPYLLSLFKNAIFIVLIREPVDFVASSIKQDILFCKEQRGDKNKLMHTDVTQHFEFGMNKRPVNFGNNEITKEILEKIDNEDTRVEAWAKYWVSAYEYVGELLENKAIAPRVKVVRYEDMCKDAVSKLQEISSFCELEGNEEIIKKYGSKIKKPSYYSPDLSAQELERIKSISRKTAEKFGYKL